MKNRICVIKTAAISLLLFAQIVVGQTTTAWRGTVSTAWEDPANWTNGLPSAIVRAIFADVVPTRQPTISTPISINEIEFRTASTITLTFATGSSLTVNTVILVTGGNTNRNHIINIGAQTMVVQGNLSTSNSRCRIRPQISTGSLLVNGNLTLGTGGTITVNSTGTLNVRGNLSGSGALRFNGAGFLYIGGNNTTNGTFTRGSSTVTYDGTGNQTVRGTTYFNLVINKTSGTARPNAVTTVTNTFNLAEGTLSIGNTLTVTGTTVVINGILTGTGAVTLSGRNATINGTGTINSTGNLNLTTGAKTIVSTANLSIASPIVIGTATRPITVTNNGTVTSTSATGITASNTNSTWVNAANSTLNIAGPLLNTGTLNALANPNVIHYNGTTAAQTIKTTTYHHLTITKGTQTASVAGNLTINGNLTVNSGTLNTSTYTITVGSNYMNNGVVTSTGVLIMSGNDATMSGTGINNLNTLTVTGAGTSIASNTSLTIADNLSTSSGGTLTHLSGGTGSITMSGTNRTISGNGIQLYNVNVSGSVTMNNSIAMSGNLNVTGSLTGLAGTTLTMNGSGSVISGNGTINLRSLSITDNVVAITNVQINENLLGGLVTATGGTFTFFGSPSMLSGVANLFNVTVNSGATLRLNSNSLLGIAGTFTLIGTLDVTGGGIPNTVNYNGSGAQTIISTTYHNLTVSNGNTKTAGGVLNINGNLTIGNGTTLNAGAFTHTVQGNWINNGTFIAGTSTIQLTGANNAVIQGTSATTFNVLTINKSSSTNTISASSNITVATINMTNGVLDMGTNNITITTTRTGNGYIYGSITRTHTFSNGTPYAFESPFNTITFTSVGTVSSVTVVVTLGSVTDFPFGGSISRQYNIAVTGSGYTATLRLHYLDNELNGNNESSIQLWQYNGTQWVLIGKTANNSIDNWVEQSGLTNITNRWTLSDNQNVVRWNGSTNSDWSVAANWTVVQGSPSLPPSLNDIVELGTASFINQPTITTNVTVKNLTFGSAQPVTLTLSGGGSLTTNGINGQWTSNAVHTMNIGSQTLVVNGNITLGNGNNNQSINLVIGSGSVTVTGSLIHSNYANVNLASGTLSIGVDYIFNGGTFNGGTGTVVYNGTSTQTVAGLPYYNLTINKSSGTATLNSAATVGGNLTVQTGGSFVLNENLSVSGNVNIGNGATLNANASQIMVGGNWIRNGTFTAGSSVVILNGATNQSVDPTAFNTLIILKTGGVATLNGAVTIGGDFIDSSGTIDISTYTLDRSTSGGVFRMASGTTLRLSGASNFPANYSQYSFHPLSMVEYYGTNNQTVQGNITYGTLFINKTGGTATLGNSATVAGDVVIQSGDLNAAGYTLTVQGNWSNNGTFTPSTGTVQLSGSNKTVGGSTPLTFNNLTISGSYTLTNTLTTNGVLSISGSLTTGINTVNVAGNLFNNGTFNTNGTVNFIGSQTQNIAMNSGFVSTGTVNFNGTIAPIFSGSAPSQLNNVVINNSGGIAPSSGWTIGGTFTVAAGASFIGGEWTHVFNGQFTNNGSVTNSGTLIFSPSTATTITLLGTSFNSTGIVEFGGNGEITIIGSNPTLFSVTVSNTSANGITFPANWTFNGDLNITSTGKLNGGNQTITIYGSFICNGQFNPQTSTILLRGTNGSVIGTSVVFNNITIYTGATVDVNSDITIYGNFIVDGSLILEETQTVTFSGSVNSLIGGSINPISLPSLVVAKTGAAAILVQNISDITELNITGGVFDIASYTLSESADGGSFNLEAGCTLRIAGASNFPQFESFSLDPTSTVEYYGSVNQTITPQTYGNLLLSGSGIKTIASAITIQGDVTITDGTPVALAPVTITVNGNWQNNGAFDAGNSMIVFTGTLKNINGTTTFMNCTINGTITNNGNTTINGALAGSGTLTQAAGSILTITGSPVTLALLNAATAANTVIYNGSVAQTIVPGTYYDLVLQNSGSKTAFSNILVNNNLTILNGSNLTINNNVIVQVLGRAITSGSLVNNGELRVSD